VVKREILQGRELRSPALVVATASANFVFSHENASFFCINRFFELTNTFGNGPTIAHIA
jgi:H+/gluconate symporter-like permease